MYIHTYTCVYIYIYIHIFTHVAILTYIHKDRKTGLRIRFRASALRATGTRRESEACLTPEPRRLRKPALAPKTLSYHIILYHIRSYCIILYCMMLHYIIYVIIYYNM